MITVSIYRNNKGDIYGFTVSDHSESFVCAAVSALVLNTVNSLEAFTDEPVRCTYEEAGGYLFCELPGIKNGNESHDADLLLSSMALGLRGIQMEYEGQITLIDDI